MKTRQLVLTALLLALSVAAKAQGEALNVFSEFKLEARGDFEYGMPQGGDATYGFRGRYFNLHLGGTLGGGFSYYLRQRIIAHPGSVTLFDNTDFLYLNYNVTPNLRLRFGKDALAVGGFEYDARPIDVYFNGEYWNNFYCFQPGASVAYTVGGQTFVAQVANSPSVHYGGPVWNSARLSYNLMWMGAVGPLQTLWSVNMFRREDNNYMNYIALGNRVDFGRWALYVDLMHHALAMDDWGHNYCLLARADVRLGHGWSLFAKGVYEQNKSDVDLNSAAALDMLVPAGMAYTLYGGGFEYRPVACPDVRLHGYVAARHTSTIGNVESTDLVAALGATWDVNVHHLFKRK